MMDGAKTVNVLGVVTVLVNIPPALALKMEANRSFAVLFVAKVVKSTELIIIRRF